MRGYCQHDAQCGNVEKFSISVFGCIIVRGEENGNNIFPRPGIEPGPLDSKSYTLPVAIKAGLYRKAVQVCYIPIPGDILPLQIEIRP